MPPRRSSWIAGLSPRSKAALRLAPAIFVITVIAAAAATSVRAGNYPSKTFTIIAPASPGGVTDLLARMLARRFITDLGRAGDRGKQTRRQQSGRRRICRATAGRRLYAVHRPGDDLHRQSVALSASRLRSGERFHADHRSRQYQSRAGA